MNRQLRRALFVSAGCGVVWNGLVLLALGHGGPGALLFALHPCMLLSGIVAGVAAGAFTVRSRQRHGGTERFRSVVATYFLGAVVWWTGCSLGSAEPTMILRSLGLVLVFATLMAWLLLPLCLLTRELVWTVHERAAPKQRPEPDGAD